MFTHSEYLWGWLWYIVGVALCMTVFWAMTRKIPWRSVRQPLRVFVASIFLMPWYVDENQGFLAPAWIASALEGAFEGPGAFWRAGTPLLVSAICAVILSLLVYAVLAYADMRRAKA
ncbi:MAG: hypothetical protein K6L76_09730 [Agarilytica sp.]